jgi:hypothetical protein
MEIASGRISAGRAAALHAYRSGTTTGDRVQHQNRRNLRDRILSSGSARMFRFKWEVPSTRLVRQQVGIGTPFGQRHEMIALWL